MNSKDPVDPKSAPENKVPSDTRPEAGSDEEIEAIKKIADSMQRVLLAQEWESFITAVGEVGTDDLTPAVIVRVIGRYNSTLDVDVHDSIWGVEDLRRFAVSLLNQCRLAEEAGDPKDWPDAIQTPLSLLAEKPDENP